MHIKAHTVFESIAVPYSSTESTFKKKGKFNRNIDLTSWVPLGKRVSWETSSGWAAWLM